jgi:hypothetical protein
LIRAGRLSTCCTTLKSIWLRAMSARQNLSEPLATEKPRSPAVKAAKISIEYNEIPVLYQVLAELKCLHLMGRRS